LPNIVLIRNRGEGKMGRGQGRWWVPNTKNEVEGDLGEG